MLLLAHRGYHAAAPENTMAAFDAAVRLGVDGIETDVRLSADGKAVIVHDRLALKRLPVAQLTHGELEAAVGHAVPQLQEILEAFSDTLWNIEIKTPESWDCAAPILARFQDKRRLLVTSFRHDVIVQCAARLGVDCGLLLADRPLDVNAVIQACSRYPRIKTIVWDYNILDAAAVCAVAQTGWDNYVYGAVTLDEHEQCKTLDIAGVITDFPRHLLNRS